MPDVKPVTDPKEFAELRAKHLLARRNYSEDLVHDIAAEILSGLARGAELACEAAGADGSTEINKLVRATKEQRRLADGLLGPGRFPCWIDGAPAGVAAFTPGLMAPVPIQPGDTVDHIEGFWGRDTAYKLPVVERIDSGNMAFFVGGGFYRAARLRKVETPK